MERFSCAPDDVHGPARDAGPGPRPRRPQDEASGARGLPVQQDRFGRGDSGQTVHTDRPAQLHLQSRPLLRTGGAARRCHQQVPRVPAGGQERPRLRARRCREAHRGVSHAQGRAGTREADRGGGSGSSRGSAGLRDAATRPDCGAAGSQRARTCRDRSDGPNPGRILAPLRQVVVLDRHRRGGGRSGDAYFLATRSTSQSACAIETYPCATIK